ncbi:hypothetical protein PYW07_006438 [Mythimna separata]|uniref:Myotubularin-related protein 13 n=1 Tax=Mythimna separata TaxID=271217 RepID=A0AAD7YTL6_MYTSE|nr:hypothetical protein PYW07_006438 [Mythimna separata]
MNCALQSATALDEHTIAAAMLPLATAYCRKLCTGVIQYAYMCIQEHPVWTSQQFWEAAFYQDVQRDIKALYLPNQPTHHQRVPSPRDDEEYMSLLKAQEPSALEIAAEQMRLWPSLPPEKQRELIASEESTLYSQAIHYANRMVYLLLPLEGAGRRADVRGDDADRASNSITNSQAIHYANRMVYLLLPLEGAGRRADVRGDDADRASNSITNSQAIHYANRMVYLLLPLEGAGRRADVRGDDADRASNSITNSQAIHYANRMVYLLLPLEGAGRRADVRGDDADRASNSITNSQAIHYANRMVYLLLPLEGAGRRADVRGDDADRASNSITNSQAIHYANRMVYLLLPLEGAGRRADVRGDDADRASNSITNSQAIHYANRMVYLLLPLEGAGRRADVRGDDADRASNSITNSQAIHYANRMVYLLLPLEGAGRRADVRGDDADRASNSITNSQAIHYANRMVYLLLPLEGAGRRADVRGDDADRASNSITNSQAIHYANRMVYLLLPLEGAGRRADVRGDDADRASNSITNSQAIHYANRMVYLLLPLEGAGRRADVRGDDADRASNSITNSQAIHYANRMVYLLLPLEGAGRRADVRGDDADRASNSITNSQAIHYANRMVYLLLPLEGAGRRADVRGDDADRASNSITNSQAIHYANRMVYLLLPLEGAGRRADVRGDDADRASNSITNSVAESDSVDAESGFEEADPGEAGNNVIKMVSRFVDKVCTEGGVTADHVRCLHQMIPGVVHMHLETLDAVARESRRLPPVQKPRIVAPALVPGETVSVPALRAYLVSDGRNTALLPAEGALFLTNYRLVFKGTPTDPYACEQTVVRSFPLCSLTREKQVRTHYLPHLEQSLQEGLQLRSATFQLIKVALDEEVSSEAVEAFRKQVARLRHPEHVLLHFALAPRSQPPPKHSQPKHHTLKHPEHVLLHFALAPRSQPPPKHSQPKHHTLKHPEHVLLHFALAPRSQPPPKHSQPKHHTLKHPEHVLLHFALAPRSQPPPKHSQPKHHTLKGFAKKTLLKTARRAGLKPKPSKRQKYVLPSADARSLTSPPLMSSLSADTLSLEELELGGSETTESPAARTLERVRERVYARDWARLGLAQPPFRLAHANAVYTLCRSYPAVIPVPESFGDDSLRRISRCYRQGRLPVITWRHPRTHALLARSAAPHHKGVMGMLKASHQTPGNTQSGTETTSSLEQERYLATLVACTPASRGDLEDSSLSLDSLLLCCEDQQATHTPLLTKAAGTLGVLGRNSGGKGGASGTARHFGRWGSLKDRRQPSHLDLYAPRQRLSTADADSVCGETAAGRRASLYVVCEKGGAACNCAGAELVPAEYPDARATKHAFKKLMRAAVPSAPPAADHPGFLRLIEESGWLWQLRQLFQLSGAVVDLLDLQGSSVLLSLEDGWDATAQISSLAQICLEPYYRTLEGFRILVEKEWLALGHKFQQRSNIGATPQQGFTPTFLMFLDAVHQLQKQFPLAFEFNEYYLRFVAYHSVSCRFRTFLLDNEAQRAELGITAADDKRADTNRMVYLYGAGGEAGAGSEEEAGPGAAGGRAPQLGHSLFDYIDRHHQKAPVFYNFLYTPDLDNPVLRPVSSISALEVWQYYTSEELSHGAPYDLEVLAPSEPETRHPQRRVVTAGYDSIARSMPDSFTGLLERIRQLELELGHLPQKWRVRWDQLELPNTLELQRNSSMSSGVVRLATLAWHKRGTLEVLVRGRLAAAPPPPAPAHRWAPAPAAAPARCDHCQDLLWGPLKMGVRCVDCGASCHERCAEAWAPPCTKYKAPPPPDPDALCPPLSAGVATLQSSSQQYYEQFSSNVAENRTHEGHLYKRGALLKGWKQRWFVLDSIKHQLRYYDAMEDSHCKGFIDLAEVITVTQASPAPGPPKKCDDRSFFDLRTSRRTYNFCASDANAAQEWIEKLQACLQ